MNDPEQPQPEIIGLSRVRSALQSKETRLQFPASGVRKLVEHASKSPRYRRSYLNQPDGPKLWLVADQGIYLVSNGLPPLLADGTVGGKENGPLFVVYAKGIERKVDPPEELAERKANLFRGDDGLNEMPIDKFEDALSSGKDWIEITCDRNGTPEAVAGIEEKNADFDLRNLESDPVPQYLADITFDEMKDVLDSVIEVKLEEDEISYYLDLLEVNLPGSNISDLIYWPNSWFGEDEGIEIELSTEQILMYAVKRSGRQLAGTPSDIALPKPVPDRKSPE